MTDPVAVAAGLVPGLAARADDYDRAAAFPAEDIAEIRRSGLSGLMVPRHLGGLGAGFADYVRVAMQLATGNAATALLFNMHCSVTGALAGVPPGLAEALGVSGPALAELDRLLEGAAAGAMYGVAISEAGDTAPLSDRRTRYREEAGGYRIQGSKVACSGAGYLDAYLVAASPDGGAPLTSYFVVPAGEGVEPTGSWDPLGMRATASRGLALDVWVGREAMLGGVEGLAVPLAHAMPQWLTISYAAIYVGLARSAVAAATEALGGRDSVPPGRRQVLGRAVAATDAASAQLLAAAGAVDEAPGDPATNRLVYGAKLIAGDTALRVAADLAEACGLRSLQRGGVLERIYRDARMGALMPPRSDVSAAVLGAMALEQPIETLEEPVW